MFNNTCGMNERINQSFNHLIVLFLIEYVALGILFGELKHRNVIYKTENSSENWSEDKWHTICKHLKKCLEHSNWSKSVPLSFIFLEDIGLFSGICSQATYDFKSGYLFAHYQRTGLPTTQRHSLYPRLKLENSLKFIRL